MPAHGLEGAVVQGLTVNGRAVAARPNTLVPLGPGSYLVVLQEAVVPGEGSGVVGLRVVAGDSSLGIEPGSQLLVGLARAALPPQKHHRTAHLSWLALGVTGHGADTGSADLPPAGKCEESATTTTVAESTTTTTLDGFGRSTRTAVDSADQSGS